MTYSILSIIANQLSPSGCSAFTYALDAFQPYTRAPWYQFSEQQVDIFAQNGGTNPAFPFLTGHGGFNQIGPFGWLGLRTDQPTLYIEPSLPPQIQNVKVRSFYYSGATINAVMNYTHTTVTRVATNSSFVKDSYGSGSMPIVIGGGHDGPQTQSLGIGQSLTVPNRRYSDVLTTASNLLQCLPATSSDPHRPGQFPLAAVDGAISTSWQPSSPNRASITIDMESVDPQPVLGISLNWGLVPPASATVILTNSSSFTGPAMTIPINNITISETFNANDVVIQPFKGNTTNLAISASSPIYTGRYVRLEIQGTQGPSTNLGGSVAEFALIGAKGGDEVQNWDKVYVYQMV